MRIKTIAKFCAIALTLIFFSPVSASGSGTSLDNGRDWVALPDALAGYGFGGGLAVSADGQIIYVGGEQIRFSNDGGKTWSNRSGNIDSVSGPSVATSASGAYVVAVTNQQKPWVSSDYGMTWNAPTNIPGGQITSMSSSGQYIAVTNTGGYLYMSRNYGASFTMISVAPEVQNRDVMSDVEISADGSRIMVSTKSPIEKVYLSTDFGNSFSEIPSSKLPSQEWNLVDISGDGMTLFAGRDIDNLWISRDGGITWTLRPMPGERSPRYLFSSAVSYDGSKITIGIVGTVVTSSDGGITWVSRPGSANVWWFQVATSQDGYILYGNGGGTTMYKSTPTQIWFDRGTVTFFLPTCDAFSGRVASIGASSVALVLDTMTAGLNSDGSTYAYYTETDTAGWGAIYDYGQSRNVVCEYASLSGTVTLTRGRFISASSPGNSETTTNTTDFFQYVGNTKVAGVNGGAYRGGACGNLTVPRAASVTISCTPSILSSYTTLSQTGSVLWRDGSQTTGVSGNQSSDAYVLVKVRKSALSGASGATFIATETFTMTSL